MRATPLALWALTSACGQALPEVEPSRFACENDAPLEGGLFPCGASHWCAEDLTRPGSVLGTCAPRLGCVEPELGFPGCDPDRRRCEPVVTPYLAAVRCEGGRHTSTSTRPADPSACACPDGLHCVAYLEGGVEGGAAGDPFQPDLRFLPSGGAAPGPERPERRLCVRACSEEDNCPPGHTCRPARVEGPGLATERGLDRNTIAVCYPDLIPETSTTSQVAQPRRGLCRDALDCPAMESCGYELEPVLDHPVAPIGSAWGERLAFVARCAVRSGRVGAGLGCTSGQECDSGVCLRRDCVRPCDPAAPERACGQRVCIETRVMRSIARGDAVIDVVDWVSVCEPS